MTERSSEPLGEAAAPLERRRPRFWGALVVLGLLTSLLTSAGAAESHGLAAGARPSSANGTLARNLQPIVTDEGAKPVATTTATLYATINGNGLATTYVIDYGTTTSYGQETSPAPVPSTDSEDGTQVSQQLSGLLAGTTYHFQFVATNGSGTTDGGDATFTTLPPSPPVVTGETAESVTVSSATLYVSIDANSSPTNYVINYGTTTSYGQQTASVSVGDAAGAQETSQAISGLLPNTTYHFQFVATNAGGTTNGNDTVFTTTAAATTSSASPPTVSGESAQSVTSSAATVLASINPNGSATTYVVQYGPTTAYGEQTAAVSVGSGSTAQTASQPLAGLESGTTYHYRFVATNAGGVTNGADATLSTAPGSGSTTTSSKPPTVPPPVKGQTVNVFPVSGTVLVNGQVLKAGRQIPFGALVDTTHGTVLLQSISPTGKLQSAKFWDALFQLISPASQATELDLKGGNFGACSTKGVRLPAAAGAVATTTRIVRTLWGNGHGEFTTKGRFAAATVRGTVWETVDRCDGTLVKVTQDSVTVTDLFTGAVYTVTQGHAIVILAP